MKKKNPHIKFNKFTIFILLICSILFLFWTPAFANPVAIGFGANALDYLLIYLITVFIEFLIIYLLLDVPLGNNIIFFFLIICLANLITFPLVQFIVIDFLIKITVMNYYPSFIYLGIILGILIVELIAIGIEYLIISSILNRFYDDDKIKNPINNKSIFYYVILANIASFALGSIIWRFFNAFFYGVF